MPIGMDFINSLLDAGWFASLVSDPHHDTPSSFSPICKDCAREIYGADMLAQILKHKSKVGEG